MLRDLLRTRLSSSTRLALALALPLGGLIGACFDAPSDDVLFSCEVDGLDRCPPNYSCEADGCCHRDGSDVQANFGACALSGAESGDSDTGTEATSTDSDAGTESTSTDSETDSGSDSGSDTGSDTGTDTSSDTGSDSGSDTGTDTGG